MTTQMDNLRRIASNARTGHCIECRWFAPDESFNRKRMFRKSVETVESIRFGQCRAHLGLATSARKFDCKGRNFEWKDGSA